MATVAAINTNFTATTGNFEKGSKRVERMAASMGSRIRGNLAAVIPGFGQLVSAAAIGFLVKRAADAFKRQLEQLGALSDASVNLGIATDQLQSLRFGAGQAGVGAEELDKAVAKMSDTIADAADGDVKEAVDAIKALGLSAADLARLRPDEQLRKVSDALANIGSTTRRIQLARDVFGRSGVNLIAFLQAGSRGIDQADKAFRELGGTLTEVDVAAADNASDALDRIGVAFDNLGNQLAVSAAPGVTLFADSLAQMTGAAANAVRGQHALAESYLTVNKVIGNWLQRVGEEFGVFEVGPERAGDFLQEEWDRILRSADDAAQRSRELREGVQFGDADAAAKTAARRSIEPAAVEVGTTAAIEAINKASTGGNKKEEKEMVRQLKDVNKNLEDVERALAPLGGFAPADLE